MKKNYTIDDNKFVEAKNLIMENGGKIYTDNTFEIRGVEGFFKYDGVTLTVKITDKPWLASWGMIEEKMDEFFKK